MRQRTPNQLSGHCTLSTHIICALLIIKTCCKLNMNSSWPKKELSVSRCPSELLLVAWSDSGFFFQFTFLLLDVVNNTTQPSGCLIWKASWTSAHKQMRRLLSPDDFATVVGGISWQVNLNTRTSQCPGTIISAGGYRRVGMLQMPVVLFL